MLSTVFRTSMVIYNTSKVYSNLVIQEQVYIFLMSMHQTLSGFVLCSRSNSYMLSYLKIIIPPLFKKILLSVSAGKSGHVAALDFRYKLCLSNARCHNRFLCSLGMLLRVQ